ncbi:hypothetical protein OU995_18710 [Roseateles sp. SL47]|uniref:type III secretion HpaP family protein n=1 Tax=Roseateles sp. SL47 TaxID=2995138 RepID=UPI00226DD0E3|nr:type III secretion HpaP family protein [Roseateles sp. SL47]WAC71603.1 hypothetical protein OU995_18710 [Roseateles sp. SL47]
MNRDINRLPESGTTTDTPGGTGATALIAQLFRQVLRLQPRTERSGRTPFPDADAAGPSADAAWRAPAPDSARLTPDTPLPTGPQARLPGNASRPGPGAGDRHASHDGGVDAAADIKSRRGIAAIGQVAGADGRGAGRGRLSDAADLGGTPAVQAASDILDRHQAAGDALDQLARQLQGLCTRGASISQHWSATLNLDAHALPDTRLRIQASQSWIRLRFSTQSADSVRLISDHTPALRSSLEQSLDMKDQVDIDFE